VKLRDDGHGLAWDFRLLVSKEMRLSTTGERCGEIVNRLMALVAEHADRRTPAAPPEPHCVCHRVGLGSDPWCPVHAAATPGTAPTSEPTPREVHEAMQNAPHDGEPYRQARAAIKAVAGTPRGDE
jgi:hypothetical protein